MEHTIALGGRRTSPPRQVARQPGPVCLDRRTVCWARVILIFGLLLQALPASAVTLVWDPSTGPGVVGYRLYYGPSRGSPTQTIDVGNTTSFTVSGLQGGNSYYFVVTAYDANGLESLPSNEVSFSLGGAGLAVKDFNGDGQSDLVWENTSNGQRAIWFMQHGYLQASTRLPRVSADWHIAGIGDFLGNGQADLVWENRVTGQRGIWFMVDGVLQSAANLPTVSTQWSIVGAGDFNGDGQADLVWENTTTGQRTIWLLKNGTLQNTISLPRVSTQWHIAGVGDFLGNGQSDLVWENTSTGKRAIWFMVNGSLQGTLNLPSVSTEWHIVDH
jgi:Fibronectin type III domain/FG-GAP-like repeat